MTPCIILLSFAMKEKCVPASNHIELQTVRGPGPTPASVSPSVYEAAPVLTPTSATKLLSQQKSSHHAEDNMKPSQLDFGSASMEQASSPDPTNTQLTTVEVSTEVLTTDKTEVPPSGSADDNVSYYSGIAANFSVTRISCKATQN